MLKQIENMIQEATRIGRSVPPQALDAKHLMEDELWRGTLIKVDLGTGLLVQSGTAGKREWLRDHRLIQEEDKSKFDIGDRRWADHTAPMVAGNTSDLAMIKNDALWRPGQRLTELEPRILNIGTRECRRVPFPGIDCFLLCFSRDRRRCTSGPRPSKPEGPAFLRST